MYVYSMWKTKKNEKASPGRSFSITLPQGPGQGLGLQCQGPGSDKDFTLVLK